MKNKSSATHSWCAPLHQRSGVLWGLIGVFGFSFSVPFTRLADRGLSPLLIGSGRAVIAAMVALPILALTRSRLPRGDEWGRLVITGGGIAVGFPLLTSFAMTRVSASHGAVVIALLPAATAVTVVLRTREHPSAAFWLAAIVGAGAAVAFTLLQAGGPGRVQVDDLLLVGAVIAAAIGYAEGGLLARSLGAWQTVSWALVLCAPPMAVLTAVSVVHRTPSASTGQWAAFAYICFISAYLGYFAWYRGLAIGPMARVSQVQLVQPVLSICWSALILGESIGLLTVIGAVVVILSAGEAVRARQAPASASPPVAADAAGMSTSSS